jgi:hypothetical protein
LRDDPVDAFAATVQWIRFYAPLITYGACAIGGIVSLLTTRRLGTDRVAQFGTVLLLLLGISLLGQVRTIKDWPHLIPTSIFALILVCIGAPKLRPAWSGVWSWRLARWALAVVAVPISISYLVGPALLWGYETRTLWSDPCPWAVETAGCARIKPDLLAAVQYVRAEVEPGRSIFVGNTRNDRLWGSNILFYFLTDRPSATRYQQLEPGVTTTSAVQLEIIGELQRDDVTHVVLFDGLERHGAAFKAGSTLLDEYIRGHYSPARTFGEYTIWKRS